MGLPERPDAAVCVGQAGGRAAVTPEKVAINWKAGSIADNAGVDFVCVLSGETTREDLERYAGTPPAIVVNTFDEVEK